MNAPSKLTELKLKSLGAGEWASDPSIRGMGQLQARRLKSGALSFYFRYTNGLGKQERLPIGKNISLAEAQRISTELSNHYQRGERDLRQFMTSASYKGLPSFGDLLQAYVLDLRLKKRSSAIEVEMALNLHVHKSFPSLWDKPAAAIQSAEVMDIIRHINDQNKPRQADKLRSYIKAAYNAAINAKQNPNSAKELQRLNLNNNPARDITPVISNKQQRQRNLSLTELQAYWHALKSRKSSHFPASALLRFHLLTGGQRIEQIAKATLEDLCTERQTITLQDPKGRRQHARVHEIPLLPAAIEEIIFMQKVKEVEGLEQLKQQDSHGKHAAQCYLWSITGGQAPATYHVANKELKAVIEQLKEQGQISASFTLGDIRRTIETRLAAEGIHKEIRAQLLSHGLSGVQDKHYNRHDYLKEKKEALEALYTLMQTQPGLQKPEIEDLKLQAGQEAKLKPKPTAKVTTKSGREISIQGRRRAYVQNSS